MKIFLRRQSLEKISLFIIFAGLFLFPHSLRMQIIHSVTLRTYLWNINFVTYLGVILLYYFHLKSSALSWNSLNGKWYYVLPVCSLIPLLASINAYDRGLGYFIVYTLCCVFPLYLLFYEIKDDKNSIIRFLLKIFNIIIILLVISALLDSLFDKMVIRHLAEFFTIDGNFHAFAYASADNTEANRFYSIYGHPLENATFFNMFFILNYSFNKKMGEPLLPTWLCMIISFLGIACCGSKGGLLIFLALIFVAYYNNMKLLIAAAILVVVVFATGLMDNLILRLTTQNFSNGRFQGLSNLLHNTETPLLWWIGYGDVSEYGPYSPVFEFPSVVMAFNYGIIFAVIVLGTMFFYCCYRFLANKNYQALLFWILFFMEINTYNFMAYTLDSNMIYCFFMMLLINISDGDMQRKEMEV